MSTNWLATINNIFIELSTRAVLNASLAIFVLLLLVMYFGDKKDMRQYLFLLLTAVVLFTSSVLIATAFSNLNSLAI